jgi:hypothetical protein
MIVLRLTDEEAADVLKGLRVGRRYIKTTHRIDGVAEAIRNQVEARSSLRKIEPVKPDYTGLRGEGRTCA